MEKHETASRLFMEKVTGVLVDALILHKLKESNWEVIPDLRAVEVEMVEMLNRIKGNKTGNADVTIGDLERIMETAGRLLG